MAWCVALLSVLLACSERDTIFGLEPRPIEPPPASIIAVSSTSLTARAGEKTAEDFTVRVRDANGRGVRGASVSWRVVTGNGRFIATSNRMEDVILTTRTDGNGLARAGFWTRALGTTIVTASVTGVPDPVTFDVQADVLVIQNGFWGIFLGPNDSTDVTVPVGNPVEWLNYWPDRLAHIAALVVPSGGSAFASEGLGANERFRFVPEVPGTWEYVWYYEDNPNDREIARLTVVPPTNGASRGD